MIEQGTSSLNSLELFEFYIRQAVANMGEADFYLLGYRSMFFPSIKQFLKSDKLLTYINQYLVKEDITLVGGRWEYKNNLILIGYSGMSDVFYISVETREKQLKSKQISEKDNFYEFYEHLKRLESEIK